MFGASHCTAQTQAVAVTYGAVAGCASRQLHTASTACRYTKGLGRAYCTQEYVLPAECNSSTPAKRTRDSSRAACWEGADHASPPLEALAASVGQQ